MNLDDVKRLERLDPHEARRALSEFPAQCRRAVQLTPSPAVSRVAPRVVVWAGMGGSAASGDLLAACAADTVDVPVLVHRGYGLPAAAGASALVVASSYSGETAEVLSAFDVAVARKVPLVTITAGGALAERATAHGVPRVAVPPGLMPRMALGYLFFPALAILTSCGVCAVSERDVAEAIEVIDTLAQELIPARLCRDNEAKRLALSIGDRRPAIYGGPATGAIAYRWKTDLEENAKMFALAGALPEMNHNEIEAWRTPAASEMHLLMLRDLDEPAEITRRFAVLGELVRPVAGGVSEAWSRGRGQLARLLSLTYLGEWVSYYLALLREVDPWTVPLLDDVKRRLRR